MIRKPNFKLNWKYALGEILLIFIGISLAIGFQNWNEGRKNDIARINILTNLEQELTKDSISYLRVIELLEGRKSRIDALLKLAQKLPDHIDSTQVLISLTRAAFITTYSPNFSVYNEPLGSGRLSLIKSNEIKDGMAHFKANVASGNRIEDTYHPHSKMLEKAVIGFLSKAPEIIGYSNVAPPSYKNIRFDLSQMVQDQSFIESLKFARYYTEVEHSFKKGPIMNSLSNLKRLINQELKK